MPSNIFSIAELQEMGVQVFGKNIQVSRDVRIYNPKNLILHDHIRIDDFTILSCKGKLEIYNFVHISSNVYISSSTQIIIHNFCGISNGCKVFGGTDDYIGGHFTNPTVPEKYKKVEYGDIIFEKHALVGSNSVILPNVVLREGTSVGALSLVNRSTEPWKVYVGSPIRAIKDRVVINISFEEELLQTLDE